MNTKNIDVKRNREQRLMSDVPGLPLMTIRTMEKNVKMMTSSDLKPFIEHRGMLTYYPSSETVYFSKIVKKPVVQNEIFYKGRVISSYVLKSGKISINARLSGDENLNEIYMYLRTELDGLFEKLQGMNNEHFTLLKKGN